MSGIDGGIHGSLKVGRPITAGNVMKSPAGLPQNYFDPKRAMWKNRLQTGQQANGLTTLFTSVPEPNLKMKSMFISASTMSKQKLSSGGRDGGLMAPMVNINHLTGANTS